MVRRQAPVRRFHSFTSPAAADSPTASSLDSANARGPERCPGASMAAAFLGSPSSLMDHACQPASLPLSGYFFNKVVQGQHSY